MQRRRNWGMLTKASLMLWLAILATVFVAMGNLHSPHLAVWCMVAFVVVCPVVLLSMYRDTPPSQRKWGISKTLLIAFAPLVVLLLMFANFPSMMLGLLTGKLH